MLSSNPQLGRTSKRCRKIFINFLFPVSWSHHITVTVRISLCHLSLSAVLLIAVRYCYRYELRTLYQRGSFFLTSSNGRVRIKYLLAYLESKIRTLLDYSCDVRYWIAHLKFHFGLYFSFILYFTRLQKYYQYHSFVYLNISQIGTCARWYRFLQ